ncbi:unnamed protein product, partial [marine sediment metagenome]
RYEAIVPESLPNAVIYPYDQETGNALSESVLENMAPNTWAYLKTCRGKLHGRPYFDRSSKRWYELWCPRTPQLYIRPKIIGPEIASRGEFTLCEQTLFINNKLKGLIPNAELKENIEYLLALLNSSLLVFLHRLIAPPKGGGFFEVKTRILGRLPIRLIDFSHRTDKTRHDRMVELVQGMLSLHKQLAAARTPQDKTVIQRQIGATDRQIDRLVYELYDLTDEEVAIVEEATR